MYTFAYLGKNVILCLAPAEINESTVILCFLSLFSHIVPIIPEFLYDIRHRDDNLLPPEVDDVPQQPFSVQPTGNTLFLTENPNHLVTAGIKTKYLLTN